MKTKTMAISMMLTFFSCALFAQSQNDTVPQQTPKTDTVPKTDSTKTDTTRANAFVKQVSNPAAIAENNSGLTMKEEIVYATVPSKENEITVSGK